MKKFTKLFLSCAAVAAVTAAVATSAMAADVTGDLAGTYTDGKLSLTTEFTGTTTVLVLAPGTNSTSVDAATDILYIDQVENGVLGEMGIKGAPTEEANPGTYTVMAGSYNENEEFVVKTGTFRLGGSDQLLGDADSSGIINGADATEIIKHSVELVKLTGDNLQAADADDSGIVNGADATEIVKYSVELPSAVDGIKTISDKTATVPEA